VIQPRWKVSRSLAQKGRRFETGARRARPAAAVDAALGAVVAQVDAFDAPALERAVRDSRAGDVIDES
jgi:hypothetical protein